MTPIRPNHVKTQLSLATPAFRADMAEIMSYLHAVVRLAEQRDELVAERERLLADLDAERQALEIERFKANELARRSDRLRTLLAAFVVSAEHLDRALQQQHESSPVAGMESAVDHGQDEGAAPPPPHPLPAGEKQWPPPQLRLIEAEIKRTLAGDETGLERNKLFEGDPCGNH